ncbi:MAG: methyltransferase domain-containing protein [Candidatus Omnitrophica bacterium]|nr:methyltransferase domain-containing protein [Candidatus Omnitrophota bacterium]
MQVDKSSLAESFSRAARTYDSFSRFHVRLVEEVLSELSAEELRTGACVVDLGCGTGALLSEAVRRNAGVFFVGVDIAEGMVRSAQARGKTVCGIWADAECVPLAAGSADAVVSTSCFQWLKNLDDGFGECRRLLKPGGRLMGSLFGKGSLKEFCDLNARLHIPLPLAAQFPSLDKVKEALSRFAWKDLQVDTRTYTEFFESTKDILLWLRELGARRTGLNGSSYKVQKSQYGELLKQYVADYGIPGKGVPVTIEIISFGCQAPFVSETEGRDSSLS